MACSHQEVVFRTPRSSFSLFDSADPSDGKVDGFSDGEKKCTICSQVFTTDSQLQKHLREHESNDKVTTAVDRGCSVTAEVCEAPCLPSRTIHHMVLQQSGPKLVLKSH